MPELNDFGFPIRAIISQVKKCFNFNLKINPLSDFAQFLYFSRKYKQKRFKWDMFVIVIYAQLITTFSHFNHSFQTVVF